MIFFLALSSSVTLALFARALKIQNENTIRAESHPDKANADLAEGGSYRRRLHLFSTRRAYEINCPDAIDSRAQEKVFGQRVVRRISAYYPRTFTHTDIYFY